MPFFAFDAEDNPMRFETKSALRAEINSLEARRLMAEAFHDEAIAIERDRWYILAQKNRNLINEAIQNKTALEDLAAAHETAVADNDMLLELNASLTDERDNLKREVDHLQREANQLLCERDEARNDSVANMNRAAELERTLTAVWTSPKIAELEERNARQYERIQSLELEVDEFDSLQYRAGLLSDACDLADQERLAASNRHGRLGTVTIRELMGWNA